MKSETLTKEQEDWPYESLLILFKAKVYQILYPEQSILNWEKYLWKFLQFLQKTTKPSSTENKTIIYNNHTSEMTSHMFHVFLRKAYT